MPPTQTPTATATPTDVPVLPTATATATPPAVSGGGALIWDLIAGGTGLSYGNAIATDSSGNIFVAGYFNYTMNVGTLSLTSLGLEDIFVAKFSADGTALWARRIGGVQTDVAKALAVDANGDVFVTGMVSATVDLGFGYTPTFGGGYPDIFLVKLSGVDGTSLWARRMGGVNDDIGYGVAVDSHGNVVLTGYFRATVSFGGTSLVSMYGGNDTFVAKYSGVDGSHLWSKKFVNNSQDIGYGVAVDGADDIFVTGTFMGAVNFGCGSLASAGGNDIFLAKLSGASGSCLWSERFGNTGYDIGYAVAADPLGNVAMTGVYANTVDFGNGPLPSAGPQETVVALFSGADGRSLWSTHFGGASSASGYGIAADPNGNIAVTGSFASTANFGNRTMTSVGPSDIFAVLLSPDGTPLWSQQLGAASGDTGYGVVANGQDVLVTGSSSADAIVADLAE
jgi:hypothetical protein